MGEVLSSAHVHTTFCDGKSTAEELAVRACELGFVSLGFTSHAPQTFDEIDEVDDQLHLVDALEVSVSGIVACLAECLKACLHQIGRAHV